MSAYLVEYLNATGWKRGNIAYFRYSDAIYEANSLLADSLVRAVRVLRLHVDETAVFSFEKPLTEEIAGA